MKTLTIDIRPAKADDARSVAMVHAESWNHTYRGLIPHQALRNMINRRDISWWSRIIDRSAAILVIDIGGKIVGYATLGRNRTEKLKAKGEIYELYVLPEYQGIGLGTKLFRAARAMLRNHGLGSFVVWALEDNISALRFYDGLNGRDCAEGHEVFDNKALNKIAYIWPEVTAI